MDETFSSIDFVGQCLLDQERTSAFKKAIGISIKPGDKVLDCGTGSGILAIFAAQAGAKKVLSFEYDPYIAEVARKNIKQNNLTDKIEVMDGDIRSHEFPEGT